LLSATPGIATGGKALILHSSGDVGIGTTGAPDTKLHVVGDIKATGNIKAHVSSNSLASEIGYGKIGYITDSTWTNFVGLCHRDHDSTTGFGLRLGPAGHTNLNAETGTFLELNVGNARAMLIADNGGSTNVRIGTSTTAGDEKIHVDGNIKVTQSNKIINDTYTTESNTSMYI
jgi:hypothetical protein